MFTTARSGLSAIPLAALVCLTMFSGSTSGVSPQSGAQSGAQSASEVTMEQIGTTTFIEPTSGDAPDETPSSSKWTSPTFFSDLSAFKVTRFSSGKQNLEVVAGVTPDAENTALADDPSYVFYPKGSINPGQRPQGGSQFYAAPLDLRNARSVTLAYSVFFPSDFEWVKGGKLPGLYGGRTGCSGGDAADDCFSTRLMWRARGAGELYLYAPKDRQTPSLCNTPPLSDGGFLLEVNGRVALDLSDVFYRDVQKSSTTPQDPDAGLAPSVPDPTAPPDVGDGLLGPILGGLLGELVLEDDGTQVRASAAQKQSSDVINSAMAADSPALADRRADVVPHAVREDDEPIGFKGVFFSTFFGGHDKEWATPKDQFVWFKNFELSINELE
ncbi:hypothetical protein H4582DRAFT_1983164 [Lactarius indigo]|nr:hypothetical protein H4582DRAFT_1983164 [Lactarius indigo]